MNTRSLANRILKRLEKKGYLVNGVAWQRIEDEIALELVCAVFNGLVVEFNEEGRVF